MRSREAAIRVLGFHASLLLSVARIVLGQTTGGISGRVTDPSGAPLPGVTVEATSPSLQRTRTSVTNDLGIYRLPEAPPGPYRVRAMLVGLPPAEREATVVLGATATVDLTLRLETAAEVVVSGEAPHIDLSSTTTGTNYSATVVNHLPVARNYADIVKANPGVATDRGVTEGRSLALSIYGATSAENQWVIDGVNTTNVFKGVQGKAINNEFVQEVEVKTGGYQAEYGRALGGVVNVITKSGGNTFHGDAFVYYDSTGTAAEKQFRPGDSGIAEMRVASGERFDYGADLGGYFVKDRLWFFGAYNRVTLDGDLSRLQASTFVPVDALFPFDSTADLYSGKLTWNAASNTSIVGTVFADPSHTTGAAGADPRQGLGAGDVTPPVSLEPSTWYSERQQGGTDFGIRATQLFGSSAIATIQGSFHRDQNSLDAPPGIRYEDFTCTGGTRDDPCAPPLEPNSITGGYGAIDPSRDHSESTRKQAASGFTLYSGNHEIKAGGDYMDGTTDALDFATGGQLAFRANEYGQTYYSHLFWAVSPEDPTVVPFQPLYARVRDYGAYVQDSWRALPNLTVNVGLRWDGERTYTYDDVPVLTFNDQWQPRIGVTWDPWNDGATKAYAFAGRFSYALPTVAAALAYRQGTLVATFNFDPVSVVQDPTVIGHDQMDVYTVPTFGNPVDAGIRASSQDELIVGIERALSPSLVVGLKGTYRSLNETLEDRCDFDYTAPELDGSQCAFINPGSDGQFARGDAPVCNGLDGDWDQCYPRGPATPEARRIYRGIELIGRYSLGSALWLQASYTHSSLRGNYDGGVNQGAEGLTWPNANIDFDYPAMWHNAYGILFLDRPNRFRFDGYYQTPWNLSVGLQAFVETGAPLNQMGYFNFLSSDIYLVPRGSAGRLPTLWTTSLSLGYPIAVGPATVTLQAYLFNVFNKQIAISRDDSWSTSPPDGYPATIFDPNQQQTNELYGSVTGRSDPRTFRAAVRVSF